MPLIQSKIMLIAKPDWMVPPKPSYYSGTISFSFVYGFLSLLLRTWVFSKFSAFSAFLLFSSLGRALSFFVLFCFVFLFFCFLWSLLSISVYCIVVLIAAPVLLWYSFLRRLYVYYRDLNACLLSKYVTHNIICRTNCLNTRPCAAPLVAGRVIW